MRVLAALDSDGNPPPYSEYQRILNDDIEEVFVFWGRISVNGAHLKDQIKS